MSLLVRVLSRVTQSSQTWTYKRKRPSRKAGLWILRYEFVLHYFSFATPQEFATFALLICTVAKESLGEIVAGAPVEWIVLVLSAGNGERGDVPTPDPVHQVESELESSSRVLHEAMSALAERCHDLACDELLSRVFPVALYIEDFDDGAHHFAPGDTTLAELRRENLVAPPRDRSRDKRLLDLLLAFFRFVDALLFLFFHLMLLLLRMEFFLFKPALMTLRSFVTTLDNPLGITPEASHAVVAGDSFADAQLHVEHGVAFLSFPVGEAPGVGGAAQFAQLLLHLRPLALLALFARQDVDE